MSIYVNICFAMKRFNDLETNTNIGEPCKKKKKSKYQFQIPVCNDNNFISDLL